MTGTSALVTAALAPVLVGTAFESVQGGDADERRSAYLTWCTGSAAFRARHPSATAAFDDDHPDGCTDLCVYVDGDGRLDRAFIELLNVDAGLVGRPIEDVLPVLVEQIRKVLR